VTSSARTPYPGLRSFRREETDLFFGREDCIHTMVDRLAATRFLAVLGSSGTGKSSIVKTGLLDALDLGVMAKAGSAWRVVDFRPGGSPLRNLARRLLESEALETGHQVTQADVDLLRGFFARGPRSVVEWCADGHLPRGTNLLLLVDQFEELFRYRDYAGREEAEAFAALLIESARNPQFPLYVTLTMRSEYLGACALIDSLAETISAGLFLTPRMTREHCRAAIVGPAMVCGISIDDALTNRLLNDLATFAPWDDRRSGDQLDRLVRRGDQLPLLQYCLNRMWIRARDAARGEPITLTLADYEAIGRLAGALDAQGNEILANLGDELRPVVERVFRALTDGTTVADAVRRPTRLGELVAITGASETAVRAVVDAFRAPECNFLVPEFDPRDPRPLDPDVVIDISHESLIRQWRRLSEWLEREARSVRLWRRLKDRFEDKQSLEGVELANMRAWRTEEKLNAAWARRHEGDYPAIMKFIDDSDVRQRRRAPLVLPLVFVGMLAAAVAVMVGVMLIIHGTQTGAWKTSWQVDALLWTVPTAGVLGFALRRYGELPIPSVVRAVAVFLVLEYGGGLLILSGLMALGLSQANADHWWIVLYYAPCTLAVLAIYQPIFRKPTAWLILVVLFAGAVRVQQIRSDPSLSGWAGLFLIVTWLMWYAGLGERFWRGGTRDRPLWSSRFAFLDLPLIGLATTIAINVWIIDIASFFIGRIGGPWVAHVVISAATAVTCGYGLRRYGGFDVRRSAIAGAAIFAIDVAIGAAVIGALSSPLPIRDAWRAWMATLYAPTTLAALAVFAPAFRQSTAWLRGVVALDAPLGIVVLAAISGLVAIPEPLAQFLTYTIWICWLVAIAPLLRVATTAEAAPVVASTAMAAASAR
jgi:hypothetical protein